MKKTILLFAVASLVAVTSCKKKGCTDPTAINYNSEAEKDDGTCEYEQDETSVTIASNITTNTTWTADKVYVLASRVAVEAGAELTIEAGTIIKGQAGTGANATALLIARGGKLFANGTAGAPIIFTSVADEIMPGENVSPNLDPTLNGLWGGLIVLGNAPISAASDAVQIEGVPPSDANGLYGGSDAADNSGSITYVSIRHGGANIGEGNEINGLTLGGVGSGTTVSNIEVVGNQDDEESNLNKLIEIESQQTTCPLEAPIIGAIFSPTLFGKSIQPCLFQLVIRSSPHSLSTTSLSLCFTLNCSGPRELPFR